MNKKTVKKVLIITLCVLLAIFAVSYIIYHVINNRNKDFETEIAYKETVYKTIDTKCFVIRDEEFIESDVDGTTVSFVTNGERVARGDTVSVVFDNTADAADYLKKKELEKEIRHFEELEGQANFQTLNINSLTKKINNELYEYLDAVDKREYQKATKSADTFRDSITGKQIATGGTLDFSKKLNSLKKELESLALSDGSYTEVKTENAGYFISGSDGYENTLDFEKLDELTTKDISKAIKSKPQKISEDVVGRTVASFKWYIACVVDSDKTVDLEQGKKMFVNFPVDGVEKLPVTVYKIGDRTEKKTMVIFCCDEMNEKLADFRIEDIEIITAEYTGYKISNTAIRTLEGKQGVYIVRGNLMGFRKINIIYSEDDFSIVNNPKMESDYIKLYDQVVTEGVDLHDNKLV